MDISTAKAFIEEAIDALTTEMYRGTGADDMQPVDPIQATIAVNLDRVDRAIGPSGESMFFAIGEDIKRAVVALHGAKQALE